MRYVWKDGHFVHRSTGERMLHGNEPLAAPSIVSDLKPYASPVSGRMIEGRYDRREDLKKHGCREMDPSEFKPSYQSRDERAARVAEQARLLAERN